jgi:bifunctional DNA-binding transcriptional regulator/antitoxin component of YhaV-PrlF toxin-antitoxin module
VTSKLQLTVPKVIAEKYGIRPGDELEWTPAGESIRVRLVRNKTKTELKPDELLSLFDENTRWLDELQAQELKDSKAKDVRPTRENRGWTREELYEDRGFPRRH